MQNVIKNIFVFSIAFVLFCCTFSACTPVYVPNTISTHTAISANETFISANSGPNDVDFATSYAISRNLGVQFNGSLSKINSSNSRNYRKYNYFEGGVSYTDIIKRKTVASASLTYGSGAVESFYNFAAINNDTTLSSAEYNRIAAVLHFGYKAKNGEIIGSTRFSYIQFHTIYIPATTLQILHLKYGGSFVEPAITIKYGIPYIKFVTQVSAMFALKKDIPFSYQRYFTSFGVEIAITEK